MRKRTKVLSAKQRDALTKAVIESYERNPGAVEKTLPEVANMLASLGSATKKIEYGGIFQLTPIEKDRRLESLQKALARMRKVGQLSKEEAIQALEDTAALAEAFPLEPLEASKNDIAKLVKVSTGLALSTKGKPQQSVLKEGETARQVRLFRGVKLNLTWDKKLMSVAVEPKELAARAKALSIIGIGSDTATDVAAKHDAYFAEVVSGR